MGVVQVYAEAVFCLYCRLCCSLSHRCVVPIGALFAITLWAGNAAYLYLSVSFVQMMKVRQLPVLVKYCKPVLVAGYCACGLSVQTDCFLD